MAILVTGGAGFIGSHTCVEMLNAGYENMGLEVSLAYSGTRNRSWQAAAVSSLESCFTNARLRENRFFILPR